MTTREKPKETGKAPRSTRHCHLKPIKEVDSTVRDLRALLFFPEGPST